MGTAGAQPNQPDVLPREFECMVGSTYAGTKLFTTETKCVARCMTTFWKGLAPESDCLPPYGNATAYCVSIARLKSSAAVLKKCTTGAGADCPECYSPPGCGQDQADGVTNVYEIASASFVPGIFCERAGALPAEQKCQQTTAKAVPKAHFSMTKCYKRCLVDARSGGDVTTCMPPVSDPDALLCLEKARTKAALAMDKYCNDALYPDSVPDCGYPTGTAWASLAELAVEPFMTALFCAE
jgi:hypothetical protein